MLHYLDRKEAVSNCHDYPKIEIEITEHKCRQANG